MKKKVVQDFWRSVYVYTGVIGNSANKQRIACDKIAESRYNHKLSDASAFQASNST